MNNRNVLEMDPILKGKWNCPGFDTHFLPEEVYQKEISCLSNAEEIMSILPKIKNHNEEEAYVLPIIQNQEACICGAPMEKKASYWAPGNYPFASLEEVNFHFNQKKSGFIKNDKRSQTIVTVTKILEKEEKCYVEVTAPFSILTALVDPRKIYAAIRKKENDSYDQIMERLSLELLLYIEELMENGCHIISLADPMGCIRFNGKKIYLEKIAPWNMDLLKKCRPSLKEGILHICGQMATDLIQSELCEIYPIKVIKDITVQKTYIEHLKELAKCPEIIYIGPGCIRNTKRNVSRIYEMRLCDNEGGKENDI